MLKIVVYCGHVYRQQGQPEQALAYFQQAVALNPNELWPQLSLSDQLRDKSEFAAALLILNTIEQQFPNKFEIVFRRGQIYRASSNNEQALFWFQTAVNLNPDNFLSQLTLSEQLRINHDFVGSLEILSTLEKQHPNRFEISFQRFHTYRRQGNRNQALIELHQAINIAPDNFQLHLELAVELREQNQLEASLTEFNFLQQNNPPNFHVLFHLAQVYRKQGNYTQALIYFNTAIEIDSSNIHGHIAIVEVLPESQQFTAAWEKLTAIEQRYPQRFETLFQKGLLYRIQNNSNQAIACFQQAVVLDPNNIWGQLHLAEELRNQGQFKQSLAILEPLETKPAYRFYVLMQKGHLYRAQNDNVQALSYFQQAYSLDNSNPHILRTVTFSA